MNAKSTGLQSITYEEHDIVLQQLFAAPREHVWNLFTKSENLIHWWGPDGCSIPNCMVDFRPGGIWHYSVRFPDGRILWFLNTYREIINQEQIVFTRAFSNETCQTFHDFPEHEVRLTFEELNKQTSATLRIACASADDMRATVEMGIMPRFVESWNKLATLIEGRQGF
ncbi:Uncharacterized conserved protein YndB, AHSA1/START domain [Seinonella peptonophila]|uniref:Uncharacterized conserved protein YndB, AHSA1/START domain n=1 Tax=Seinonella peptonophila TaxID=112248 RepID=A0A1M4WNX4_9BACL|nr:SRPBCC domain-containing protein [Seinonella peptonophila]SHE82936.1 Uncharacterized conserved protein YndB, AHSA1/START domain [Seinonella peptonophila]